MIRRLRPASGLVPFGLVAAIVMAVEACAVRSLNVGKDEVPEPPDVSAPDAARPDVSPPVEDAPGLEAILQARCAEAEGVRDPYTSALTLSARFLRRWFLCGPETTTPLPAGIGLQIDAQGNYALLRWNAAHDAFVASTSPDEQGTVRYFAFVDPDSGKPSQFIALDDPSPHAGLFVYLTRTTMTDDSFLVELEKAPPRMILSRAGPSAMSGTFVPID